MTTEPHPAFDTQLADEARRAQVGATIDGIARMLAIATALVETGRRIDLSGLDSAIGQLCARTLDLPPDHGRSVRPALADLLTRVSALEAALPHRAAPP